MRFIVFIICMLFAHPSIMAFERNKEFETSIHGLKSTQVLKVELNNESCIIDKDGRLDSNIITFLTNKKPAILSIVGKKMYLGYTLEDIAKIQNFKPESLDLDLFYRTEDSEIFDKAEKDIHDTFKHWTGTRVIFRMNDMILRDFRIGN